MAGDHGLFQACREGPSCRLPELPGPRAAAIPKASLLRAGRCLAEQDPWAVLEVPVGGGRRAGVLICFSSLPGPGRQRGPRPQGGAVGSPQARGSGMSTRSPYLSQSFSCRVRLPTPLQSSCLQTPWPTLPEPHLSPGTGHSLLLVCIYCSRVLTSEGKHGSKGKALGTGPGASLLK